jgi:fructokinase
MLTSGEKGSWACSANQRVHVQAQPVEVKDAVGAGDSFHAGVLCRLSEMGVLDSVALSELKERDLKDCLEFANLIAAITCKRSGADSPTREELNF